MDSKRLVLRVISRLLLLFTIPGWYPIAIPAPAIASELSPTAGESGSAAATDPAVSIAAASGTAGGRVFYVAPTGNDGSAGSEAAPWRTITKAANTLVAGDTVYIKAGTYRETLTPRNSGAAGAPITYAAYPGHTVVLDGGWKTKGTNTGRGIVDIYGKSYITIVGLRLVNGGYYGVRIGNAKYITVRGVQTDFTYSSGINVDSSSDIVLDGNDVQRACHNVGGSTPNEHITIRNVTNFEVMNNKVHKLHSINGVPQGKEGISIKTGSANGKVHHNLVDGMIRVAIYVDGYDKSAGNVEVYANRVTRSLHGMVIASERNGPVSGIKVYNNLFYGNSYHGLWLAHSPNSTGRLDNIAVLNNTLYGNGAYGMRISNSYLSGLVVRNNILLANKQGAFQISSGVSKSAMTLDHNLEAGDAKFVASSSADFRIQEGSPAIDTGSAAAAPGSDMAGTIRPQGAAVDIGAFEYSAVGTTSQQAAVRVFVPKVAAQSRPAEGALVNADDFPASNGSLDAAADGVVNPGEDAELAPDANLGIAGPPDDLAQ